jgi:hypothetical protein
MSTISEEKTFSFVATEVVFEENSFSIYLADGRTLSVPYELIPSLSRATTKQRKNCEVSGLGTALYWPDLDEDLSVEGLVLGRKVIDWQKNITKIKSGKKKK